MKEKEEEKEQPRRQLLLERILLHTARQIKMMAELRSYRANICWVCSCHNHAHLKAERLKTLKESGRNCVQFVMGLSGLKYFTTEYLSFQVSLPRACLLMKLEKVSTHGGRWFRRARKR
jgi:hypothetical protein